MTSAEKAGARKGHRYKGVRVGMALRWKHGKQNLLHLV
jgi:hypothetical protein